MTPEEDAVIEAAIAWVHTVDVDQVKDTAEALQDCVDHLLLARRGPAPGWVRTTMRHCLGGDRIRLGQEETDVLRCTLGVWHADTRDSWRPKAWEHIELRMQLAAVPGLQQYPPNTPVEILCTPERAAVLALSEVGLTGTQIIS